MLKNANSMKDVQDQGSQALLRLLEKIPSLHIEGVDTEVRQGNNRLDLVVQLDVDGRPHRLIGEWKTNGQPRYARMALMQLRRYLDQQDSEATPVFIAPYISPAVRQMCEQENVSYLDLVGNARIAFGSVYLERSVADTPAGEQRELKSLFRPKSSQVLRVLLREPGRAWRVTELSDESGVSLGHVSNVRTALIAREWARSSDEGLILSEPDALLDSWRDSYTAPAGDRVNFFTVLHGSAFEKAARTALSASGGAGRAAFASFSAAQWIAPYGRTGTHYFYADEDGLGELHQALNLEPTGRGENVVITVLNDDGLLYDTIEPAPGAVCTSPVQTYLDLSVAGERGAEAAEHLRKEKLSWPK